MFGWANHTFKKDDNLHLPGISKEVEEGMAILEAPIKIRKDPRVGHAFAAQFAQHFSDDFFTPAIGQGAIGVECREEDAEDVAKLLKDTMENAYKLPIKLTVDTTVGKNWGEL